MGKPGYRVSKSGDSEVWMRQLEDGSIAVGLFNRGETMAKVTAYWSDLGISGKQKVRDLWRKKDLGNHNEKYKARVARHGVLMLRFWPVIR